MKRIKLFVTAVMVCLSTLAFAQSKVAGVVTDAESGESLVGAAVIVKGTMSGTTTGADGSYSIKVAKPAEAVLVISFYGYKTVEVPVNGNAVVNAALKTDATVLEETVIVAYGTQKKEAVTGSVTSVKGETLASAPVTSVDRVLAGKLAGVAISAASGQPGALTQIRIRGNGSINAGNAPLWVVDGIPVVTGNLGVSTSANNSALTNLNPNDIESITVLKDAAAAAAYGSRAANGVILVTTKSGKEGKAVFTARVKAGVNWLQPDTDFRMMTAKELLGYHRDAVINAGQDPDNPKAGYYRPLSILNGKTYNPLREFTRVGSTKELEVSARGGNSRAKYFTSFSTQNDEGVFYGVEFQRIQGRINASYKLLDNLESGVRFNLAYTKQSNVPMNSLYYASPLWAGETLLPWQQLKDENGKFVSVEGINSGENPRVVAATDDNWEKVYHLNGTVNLKWTPIKNLEVETKNSIESFFQETNHYYSPVGHVNSTANQLDNVDQQIHQLTTSNTITYSNLFGGYHSLRALVGQEAMTYKSHYRETYSPEVDPNMPYHTTADQTTTEIAYGESAETMLSFFGIVDYNFDNRYFAQVTFREDGSSLFGADNKWGAFWSVSGSWNATNEKFLKGIKNLDLLKVRISYGVNGNNGISPYNAYGLYGTAIYNGLTGYLPSQLENRVLSWEKNKTINFGIDFALFNNRLSGSIDVYNRKTVDLLLTKQIPQTTGFSSIFSNVGSMRNRGIEIQLEYTIFQKKDFFWSVGMNAAYNKTKILDLGGDEFLGSYRRQAVGRGMYTYYLYDYYGVNPANGEALWVASIDEKGNKTLTNNQANARRYYAGSPEPKWVGGFNTQVAWKGFSLSAFFEFKAGHQILLLNENHYLNADGAFMNYNQFASQLNYWKKPGDTGVNPKPVAGTTSNSNEWESDRYLENASYLRVKDVTLSYTLPESLVKKVGIKNAKVYVSGLNLYCFNDVNFWDPEQGVTGSGAGAYPTTKSIVGGIELTF